MAIRIVRKKDDEILRKHSKDVIEYTDKLKQLVRDMKETMKSMDGCGLAAVQVGILRKIIICAPDENEEAMVLINPEIIDKSKETEEDYEGCLSVDGVRGKVVRPKKIVVKAKDESFNDIKFVAEGFAARIICHEVDHLDGILYTDVVIPNTLEMVDTEKIEGKSDKEI